MDLGRLKSRHLHKLQVWVSRQLPCQPEKRLLKVVVALCTDVIVLEGGRGRRGRREGRGGREGGEGGRGRREGERGGRGNREQERERQTWRFFFL